MYADFSVVIDDVVAQYDNTDGSAVHNSTTRRLRILHYGQRTMEKIWFHRAWPFAMATDTIAMVTGSAALPDDFARISYEGAVFGPGSNVPWVEISWQDMQYLRKRTLDQSKHYYAIGPGLIQIPNVSSSESFTMMYQTVAPALSDSTGIGGLPAPFGEALLLGTVYKLKEEEGDARTMWRNDFNEALARATALWGRSSRSSRMPMTIGGMW